MTRSTGGSNHNENDAFPKVFFVPASRSLVLFGLDSQLSLCEGKLRKWISKNVILPLLKDIEIIERSLPPAITTTQSPTSSYTADSLLGYFSGHPELQEAHLLLTKMVLIFDTNPSFYPLRQNMGSFFSAVRELAVGSSIDLYRWTKFSLPLQEKISNAELLIGLFCSYLDFAVPGEDKVSFSTGPFTRNHFMSIGKEFSSFGRQEQLKFFGIRHASSKPSHYDVMHRGVVYECIDGPSNVFMCILGILTIVRDKYCGYLGLLNLRSQCVDYLLSVLE